MKKLIPILVILVIGSLFAAIAYFRCPCRGGAEGKHADEILVLCGGSMRAALEASVVEYKAQNPDANILTTYGGSGELCAQIQQTGRGDIYVCHDPFMPWAEDQGLISVWDTLSRLRVVIVVPKGNPKGIRVLKHLSVPGLRLGIGNQTYSTSGQIIKHLLAGKPYGEGILKNIRIETKGHQQRCNDVAMGLLDAGLVWDAVAALFAEKLDIITMDEEFEGVDALTSATYKKSDMTNTKVTVGIIKGAEEREDVRAFYDFLKSEGKRIFSEHGFSPAL